MATGTPMYELTKSLPFMLLTITGRVASAFAAELAEDRLTIPMYRVLAALIEREDQRLGELGEMIFMEITALSRLIGAMSHRGLVSRHRQEKDERSLSINVTVQGRALVTKLIPRARYFEAIAVRGIEDAQLELLSDLLSRILANVEDLRDPVIEGRTLLEMPGHRSPSRPGRSAGQLATSTPDRVVGTMNPSAGARARKKVKA